MDLNLDLSEKNKYIEENFILSKRDKEEILDNILNKSKGITRIKKIEYKIGKKIVTLIYSKSYQKSGYSLEIKDSNGKLQRVYYSPNLTILASYFDGSTIAFELNNNEIKEEIVSFLKKGIQGVTTKGSVIHNIKEYKFYLTYSKAYSTLYKYKLKILRKDNKYVHSEFAFDKEMVGYKVDNIYFGKNIHDILETFGEVE